ncbi:hypothetical protein [Deinococcus depolymerans]|uniref:DUF1963 domain-containing protein n=1 Tax=Deinococcus depolymerans TaxID=392408 RepID=A0ABN1BR90_9DEIO
MNGVEEYLSLLDAIVLLAQKRDAEGGLDRLTDEEQTQLRNLRQRTEEVLTGRIHPDPEAALEVLLTLLDRRGLSNAHRRLLDYIPDHALPRVFEKSLLALGMDYKEADVSGLRLQHEMLDKLQWQAPDLFHPYLSALWSKRSWESTGAWWGAGRRFSHELRNEMNTSIAHRNWAQLCLEWSGEPENLNFVASKLNTQLLENAGVERKGGEWRRLYADACYHIMPSPADLTTHNMTAPAHMHLDDLSWRINGEGIQAEYWGAEGPKCPHCDYNLQHLLTLSNPVPGVTLHAPITFVVCTYCMISDRPTIFVHDDHGLPERPKYHGSGFEETGGYDFSDLDRETYKFLHHGLPVQLKVTPSRWLFQNDFNDSQNLNRVGGPPSWLQGPEWETCPKCQQTMLFVFQLHDGLAYTNGTIYGFWCSSCRISAILNTYT